MKIAVKFIEKDKKSTENIKSRKVIMKKYSPQGSTSDQLHHIIYIVVVGVGVGKTKVNRAHNW